MKVIHIEQIFTISGQDGVIGHELHHPFFQTFFSKGYNYEFNF
jgi:hypothetical protein